MAILFRVFFPARGWVQVRESWLVLHSQEIVETDEFGPEA